MRRNFKVGDGPILFAPCNACDSLSNKNAAASKTLDARSERVRQIVPRHRKRRPRVHIVLQTVEAHGLARAGVEHVGVAHRRHEFVKLGIAQHAPAKRAKRSVVLRVAPAYVAVLFSVTACSLASSLACSLASSLACSLAYSLASSPV